ncbi:unnamed protein product [Euphydryas editha]|uniref:Regulatory protein zeste n=1 Tax=Euphydryas editha TaxID=104508 RepID=A0AAU9US84_EUPED|nr:unnamed protein product [Euphydryas editha]
MAAKHIFTQMKKKVFLDVLKSYATITENKNTDDSTLREKNVAWDNIAREYNASSHVSIKQLRQLWMNLKQRQWKALTKEQHRMATGGGPSTSPAATDLDVAQIDPASMIEILEAIDSDTVFQVISVPLMFNRAGSIHAMEKELLKYKIREAEAKAELVELILEQERSREDI